MGPTWGPPGSRRPMLAPWTLQIRVGTGTTRDTFFLFFCLEWACGFQHTIHRGTRWVPFCTGNSPFERGYFFQNSQTNTRFPKIKWYAGIIFNSKYPYAFRAEVFLWNIFLLICISSHSAPLKTSIGPFDQHGLDPVPAWMRNYICYKVWDEIACPFPNVNGAIVVSLHVTTYLCWG